MPPKDDDADEDLRWSIEAHLEFLAAAANTLDFADGRQSATAEAYVGQLLAVEQHCDVISSSSSSHAASIVELAVDTTAKVKNLPTLVIEAWCRVASTALANRLWCAEENDRVTMILPRLLSRLADAVKSLSKDRNDASITTACALDAALRLLTSLLSVLLSVPNTTPSFAGLVDACLTSASTTSGVLPILASSQLPHPAKSISVAPRISAMSLTSLLIDGAGRRGQSVVKRLRSIGALTTTNAPALLLTAHRRKQRAPRWLSTTQPTVIGATSVFPLEWIVYLRKGIEGKDFSVKEAALQALADSLWVAALPESQLSWVLELVGKAVDAPVTSARILASSSKCLGLILTFLAAGAPLSAASTAASTQALSSSSWALWRGSGGAVQDTTPITGDAWVIFRSFLKPPMTRAMQSMLGDALGIFLSLVSRSKPHWYSSAADLLMALAVPLTQQQIASSSQSASASSSGKMSSALAGDNRAYVPKIITRAVSMWCGVAAGNDTHRQAVIGSMMPFIKADLPKQVSQTALTCLSLVISSVRYLRQDLSGTLFALTKVLCITMTQVATAASDVCARVASLDVNALYSLMRMQTDLIEDVTKTEPITHALMGVSKILTALPHETLHAHAPAVLEVFMSSFCTLGNIAQYSSHSSSHATSSPTSDSVVASKIRPELEDVWRSELLARRLEQTHAFAHALLHCAASALAIPPKELKLVTSPSHQSASSPSTSSSVLVLSPAVVHCMWQSCIQHLTALLDAATQMGALPASPKSAAAPTPSSSNHNNALLLPPPPAPWLRGTLAVATTLTLLGERSVVNGSSDGTKAQQRRQSVTIWFSILRVIAQGATTENNSGPSAALLVKLKKEVWRNLSSAVRSLSAGDETASSPLLPPRTPNSAPSGKLLPQAEVNEKSSLPAAAAAAPSSSLFTIPSLKRSRQIAQRCISAALDEIDAAVRRACPIHCTDAAIFPASTSGFMTSCRRTMPLAHQVPSAISAAAATEFLATCFASPIISSASLRSDIIRSLFDMLLKPIAADGGVIARWNVAFVLHQCLHRDLLRDDDAAAAAVASSSPPPHHRRLWVSDTDLQAVASTLRLQLLGEQFCGIITTAGAAAGTATATTASLQAGGSVIDLQIISARALASLNALVDGVSSLVSQVALEQGQRATSTGGATSSSAAALEGSRSAVGSLILLSECSAVMKRTAVSPSSSGDHHRSTMDDTQQLLPLITSHMNVLLSRMTSGGGTTATSTSASQPTGATSGLFGDPCSPVAIAIGISVARMSESYGMTVLREVFPAQLQSTLLLKPTSLAVDPIVQNLLWAALCNAERCVYLQSKSRRGGRHEDDDDDEDWSAQNCGGRPASLLARHSWETAALCESITDADTLRASLSLLLDHLNCTASSLALAADAAAEGSPLRRRKRGCLGVNPQHLLMSLMTIHENKLVLSQLEEYSASTTLTSPSSFGSSLFHQQRDDHSGKSVSTLVASCVAHILAMSTSRMQQQQQQRRGGATSNFVDLFVAELKLIASCIDSAVSPQEVLLWKQIGERTLLVACSVSENQTMRLFKQTLLGLVTAKAVPLPKHVAALDDREDVAASCLAQEIASRKSEDYGEDVEHVAAAPRGGGAASRSSGDDDVDVRDVKSKEAAVQWATALLSDQASSYSAVPQIFAPTSSALDDVVKFASVVASLAEKTPIVSSCVRSLFVEVLLKYFLDPIKSRLPWMLGRPTFSQKFAAKPVVIAANDFDDFFFSSAPIQQTTKTVTTVTQQDHNIISYRTQMASAVRQLVRCVSAGCKSSGVEDVALLSSPFFSSVLSDRVTNSRVLEAMLARLCAIEDGQSVHCGEETIPLLHHTHRSIMLLTDIEAEPVAPPQTATTGQKVIRPYSDTLRDVLLTHTGIQHTLHRIAVTILSHLAVVENLYSAEPACHASAESLATPALLFSILSVGCSTTATSSPTQPTTAGSSGLGSWIGPTLRQSAGAAACAVLASSGSTSDGELLKHVGPIYGGSDGGGVAATSSLDFNRCVFGKILEIAPFAQQRHRELIESLVVRHIRKTAAQLLTTPNQLNALEAASAIAALLRVALGSFATRDSNVLIDNELREAVTLCRQLTDLQEVQWLLVSRLSNALVKRLGIDRTIFLSPTPAWLLRCSRVVVGQGQFEADVSAWVESNHQAEAHTNETSSLVQLLTSSEPVAPKQKLVECSVAVLRSVWEESTDASEMTQLLHVLLQTVKHFSSSDSSSRVLPALMVASCALCKTVTHEPQHVEWLRVLHSFVWRIIVAAVDGAASDDRWADVILPCVTCALSFPAIENRQEDALADLLRLRIATSEALRAQAPLQSPEDREILRTFLSSKVQSASTAVESTSVGVVAQAHIPSKRPAKLSINVSSFQQ